MDNAATTPTKNDLTFKPELYSEIINVPFDVQRKEIEKALSACQSHRRDYLIDTVSSVHRTRIQSRPKKSGYGFHCNLCDEQTIYRAPSNVQVKFDQYSRLTHKDMQDALFQRASTVHQTHSNLMKLVKQEQQLFEQFVKSLQPKFTGTKLSLPQGWGEFVQQRYRKMCKDQYSEKKQNYKVNTTHILTNAVSTNTPQSIERYGQILAYGSYHRLKLPKVGTIIKNNIQSLYHRNDAPLKSNHNNNDTSKIANSKVSESSAEKIDNPDKDGLGTKTPVISTSLNDAGQTLPISPPEDTGLTCEDKTDEASDSPNTSPNKPKAVLYKHVHITVSQDLDVFVTDVPVTKLGGNVNDNLTHDEVIDFIQGLKVAEIIADVDSLCLVFSSLPPTFSLPFLFRISVQTQEDGSKYCKISTPLPHNQTTPEHLKQEIITEFLFRSSAKKTTNTNDHDANIQFMEYLNDCGANLINKKGSGNGPKEDLSDYLEPMKFTSFLKWKNLNSRSLSDKIYSLFSCGDTNFVVHSEPALETKFCGLHDNTVVYVKPQYFYEYGLEVVQPSEYAFLYLKALLTSCVGAVIVHVEMDAYHIVAIEEKSLEELQDCFPKTEAMYRLNSLFESVKVLSEGNFIYNHEINQQHSVIYQDFDNAHVQADFHLSQNKELNVITSHVTPVVMHKTELTAWQRHNARLPLCFNPRKAGTYICHEFLSRDTCNKAKTCAFAHLNKQQLEGELGKEAYEKFMRDFEKPREERDEMFKTSKPKNPGFGRIKSGKGPRKRQKKK